MSPLFLYSHFYSLNTLSWIFLVFWKEEKKLIICINLTRTARPIENHHMLLSVGEARWLSGQYVVTRLRPLQKKTADSLISSLLLGIYILRLIKEQTLLLLKKCRCLVMNSVSIQLHFRLELVSGELCYGDNVSFGEGWWQDGSKDGYASAELSTPRT